MGQMIRQVGVVIGLTIILTFPVTVVSGAGPQKHSEHRVRAVATETSKVIARDAAERAGTDEKRSWKGQEALPQ